MDSARSLALGGQIIHASEMAKKSFLDANDLMLRCPFCGEPVFFKAGFQKTPHFAHFPDLPTRQLEDCDLRQKSQGGSSFWGDSQGRGQSLERFKQRIKIIFADEYKDFNERVSFSQKNLPEEIIYYSKIYLNNFPFVFDQVRRICKEMFSKDPLSTLIMREKILIEVVSYLNNKSASEVLNSFVAFSLFQSGHYLDWYKHHSHREFLCLICENIAKVGWLEAFKSMLLEFEQSRALGTRQKKERQRSINKIDGVQAQASKKPQRSFDGRDIKISITLTKKEFVNGCSKLIDLERDVQCSACKGFTTVMRESMGMDSSKCEKCQGKLRLSSNMRHKISFPAREIIDFFFNPTYVAMGLGHDGYNGGKSGDLIIHAKIDISADEDTDLDFIF